MIAGLVMIVTAIAMLMTEKATIKRRFTTLAFVVVGLLCSLMVNSVFLLEGMICGMVAASLIGLFGPWWLREPFVTQSLKRGDLGSSRFLFAMGYNR